MFETFSWGPEGFSRSSSRPGGRGFGGIDDILKDVFGGATRGRRNFEPEDFADAGRDVTASLTISLAEAAHGSARRVQLPTGKEIEVKIPSGLASGQQIRLKGQGLPGSGGRAGDLLITVSIAPHPLFQVDGADLRLELPVTLYEAVLGSKVRVPTLDGAVDLTLPPATNAGRTFRLKGKGLKTKGETGDLLVTIRIVLPDGSDAELEELMRKWRDNKPYNPRRDID
jgi:DnaJ-class molecular chaperone